MLLRRIAGVVASGSQNCLLKMHILYCSSFLARLASQYFPRCTADSPPPASPFFRSVEGSKPINPDLWRSVSSRFPFFLFCRCCRRGRRRSANAAHYRHSGFLPQFLSYFHLSLSTLMGPEDGDSVQSTGAAQNSG